MSLTLGKHFHLVSSNKVARKLFLCRKCNKQCKPKDFRPYRKNKGIPVYIATAYKCDNCNESFITNAVLNQIQKLTLRDNYNSLTEE